MSIPPTRELQQSGAYSMYIPIPLFDLSFDLLDLAIPLGIEIEQIPTEDEHYAV